jgi:hypothetical protein
VQKRTLSQQHGRLRTPTCGRFGSSAMFLKPGVSRRSRKSGGATVHVGSCLCGDITFTVDAQLSAPEICHCRQCRKQSGHCFASTDIPKISLAISGNESIKWFNSSANIRRGFCERCGSFLFWERLEKDYIAVAMGAFNGATGVSAREHIFVEDKGDYYEIGDGLPQRK